MFNLHLLKKSRKITTVQQKAKNEERHFGIKNNPVQFVKKNISLSLDESIEDVAGCSDPVTAKTQLIPLFQGVVHIVALGTEKRNKKSKNIV